MKKLMLMVGIFSSLLFAEEKKRVLTEAQRIAIGEMTKSFWRQRTEYIKRLFNLAGSERWVRQRYIANHIAQYDKNFNLEKKIENYLKNT